MEVGDAQSVSSNDTIDACPPQDVPPTSESQENAEYVISYTSGPPVPLEEEQPQQSVAVPEVRPVRRSCRMAAALVRANAASAAANNNNDLAPKDLSSRHLFSQNHSKKVIKHALRQQAKRRRKNTTFASGNSIAPIPRLVVKTSSLGCSSPVPPPAIPKASTMQEVLASIPGFNLKHRKKSARKLSAAAQLEQTKEGLVDLETPDSIFAVLNLSKLLTQETLSQLPLLYQQKLLQLLPEVDRPSSFSGFKKDFTGLSNEFFAKACLEWRRRLAEGKFSSESQQKLKFESEKRRKGLDPWKSKHFEAIWGERVGEPLEEGLLCTLPSTSSSNKFNCLPASLTPPVSILPEQKTSPCISPVVITQSPVESPPVPALTPPPEEPSLPQKRPAEDAGSITKKAKLNDSLEADFANAQELVQQSCSPAEMENEDLENIDDLKNGEISLEAQRDLENFASQSAEPPIAEMQPEAKEKSPSEFEIPGDCDPPKQEDACEDEPIAELRVNVVEEVVEDTVIETPISSIVVPLEQNHPQSTVDSSNLFEIAQQISHDNDADHDQVIEDVLKAEEEGVVKSLANNDVHTELLQQAESDLLLQAQFWSMDQNSANLLGTPSESNVGNGNDRVDNVAALAGEMELVVGQIVKDMELNQSSIIMSDGVNNVGMSSVEWPMFTNSNANVSNMQQNLQSDKEDTQLNMYVPQKTDVLPDHSKLELDMNFSPQVVTTTSPMVPSVSIPSALIPPAYCSEPLQMPPIPTPLAPSQPIYSSSPMQQQVSAAPIMTPIPLPLSQHTLPVMQPLLGPNMRAQVISTVQPQLVNCVAAVRPSIPANLIPNVTTTAIKQPTSTSPGPIMSGANNGNNSAALGGRGSRSNSKATPPGAVNLERSYQICQAVIQNSPNREQLQGQLKLPPSLVNKQATIPSRANQAPQRPRLPPKPAKLPVPPQNANRMTSIVLRQVFSPQGVPVTMAVLPPNQVAAAVAGRRNSANGAPRPLPLPPLQVVDKNASTAGGTQYILVQRPALPAPPRASSAPPVPPATVGLPHCGRPASVDTSNQEKAPQQLLGRKGHPGVPPGAQSCVCNLKAMIVCQKCGAYCHDDCITPNTRLCVTCHIR
ncbi:putative Polycomb group protein ASXL3 isoform X2 [Neocloeon triangulifer]|uniref:putative Polycomb group protein ASXL3 isoform X2 n=1 Tax=Neocloeon triangulifer TaxID=2078957 RepID=UPI00286F552A|nr:putative Polycomb group protein ASXL3 isoform X2 [Neocloeon triangulifer]